MAQTLLYGTQPYIARSAVADGDSLWLSLEELEAGSGWAHKPQGLCLGERCVPLTPARRDELFGSDGRFDLAAFARYLGQPVVRDPASGTWAFGEAPEVRRSALQTLDAPDFTLPDLDGTPHSLSEFRGKKVLLLSWASW
jgi:hypothetical protein